MKHLVVLLLVLAGLASACTVSRDNIQGFNLISVEEETRLGASFATEVEKQRIIITDPAVQGYITRLGNRLLTGVRSRDFDYTFKVVKDNSVNAFAVPGGRIYVHSGLIKAAASETELAAVIAHEISHGVARHGTQQLTQQYGYSLVMQMLLGKNPRMITQLASNLFGQGAFMAYSRAMENQADYLGVETMYRAGYDPRGMVSFLKKLDTMHQRSPDRVAQFFSTHPMTAERIGNVQKSVAALPSRTFQENTAEFKQIQGKL